MNDTIITVENLSKRYRLGTIGATSLRESAERAWHKVRGRNWRQHMGEIGVANRGTVEGRQLTIESEQSTGNSPPSTVHRPQSTDLWALKDVSFEVKRGEVLGVIGRNGAGKSTLLKLLTRITEPTSGRAIMRGRVASLLEVGTGFHPELTGRENVYLNGAILGMRRAEINAKFDEIVAFAEVEKFIDTPVKRYSSGMYVRLAFAVAAHLEPEVLLVDEVLAVGDAAFQKRCLGKMKDVAARGRTVLFVSHNMAAVSALCEKVMIISQGRVRGIELPDAAISRYFAETGCVIQSTALANRSDRKGNQELKFQSVTFHDESGVQIKHILNGGSVFIRLHYQSLLPKSDATVVVAFNIKNEFGQVISNLNSKDTGDAQMTVRPSGYFECIWHKVNLRCGLYYCTIFCRINSEIVDWVTDAFVFQVEDGDYYGTGHLIDKNQGVVLVDYRWRCIDGK